MADHLSIVERTALHRAFFARALEGGDPRALAMEYLLACDPSARPEDLDPHEVEVVAEQLTPIPGVHV